MHWPDWVQEAWATVARVADPDFRSRCLCSDCWERNSPEAIRARAKAVQRHEESFRVPFTLDPTLVMSEGLQGSMLNSGSWVRQFALDNPGTTLTISNGRIADTQ